MSIISIVDKYISAIAADKTHRYKSWDNCFKAFNSVEQTEIQTLELAFYLASWGMYRGSSGLLQKNHLIHEGTVTILYSKEFQELKCNSATEVQRGNIKAILRLKNQLGQHYSKIYFSKGAKRPKAISPTDTLLSKIILGTLGCVPAYDTNLITGMKEMKIVHTDFSSASLNELFDFIEKNKKEITEAQELIKSKIQAHYPLMKVVDMYFWQIGYDIMESHK